MPKTPEQIIDDKVDFLLDRENKLKGAVTSAERKLFSLIIKKLINELETENGQIKQGGKNIRLTAAIDRIFKDFNKGFNSQLIKQFVKDMQRSLSLTDLYFKGFTTEKRFNAIQKRSKKIVFESLGVTERGKVISGGFLDRFINDTSLKNEVVNATVRNVRAGAPLSALREELRTLAVGSGEAGGRLQRHYRTFAYDAYQEVDRAYNDQWAKELKLTAFIYSGTKIKTTRKFCCERIGIIFTRDDTKKWKDLQFSGKPDSGYNPITQLGGHNCRHTVQWISNEQAAARRKDLKLNKEGKLVKDSTGTPQQLNKNCDKRK